MWAIWTALGQAHIATGIRRGNGIGSGGGKGRHDNVGEAGRESSEDALGAVEEEVDQSIVATELAVQYLGTLATLYGALTGRCKLVLVPTELTELIHTAATVVRLLWH